MSMPLGKLEIEATDNGWIVKTDYFTHAGEKTMIFSKWKDVVNFVAGAFGVKP